MIHCLRLVGSTITLHLTAESGSHVDFAKLYVENFMAKFNAFDGHCDASAVLTLCSSVV